MSQPMRTEIARRQSLKDRLRELFEAHPGEWLSMTDLARVGGTGGFRTRISELRLEDRLHIEWNGYNGARSAHRYLPYQPLGRTAESSVAQLSLGDIR